MIQFSDYLCGGYFLARTTERKSFNVPPFPDSFLSVSSDICDFVPDAWAIEWVTQDETPLDRAKKFNLEPKKFAELNEWATKNIGKEFGAWNIIFQLETAQYLRKRFLAHLTDVTLFGIGLQNSLFDDFVEKTTPPPTEPGFAPNGEMGSHTAIKQKHALAPGGVALGFELTRWQRSGLSYSWLDIGLEEIALEMKIPINEFGLIKNFEDALKFSNLVADGKIKLGSIFPQPGIWLPWLLVDYSKV
jgi:hypothetical protein